MSENSALIGSLEDEDGALLHSSAQNALPDDPKLSPEELDSLYKKIENLHSETSQPIAPLNASQSNFNLASDQNAPTIPTQEAASSYFSQITLTNVRITNAILGGCVIINTTINSPHDANLNVNCAASIKISTNASRANASFDNIYIFDSLLLNCTINDSTFWNTVIANTNILWPDTSNAFISNGIISNTVSFPFSEEYALATESNTLGSVQPLSNLDNPLKATQTRVSCADEATSSSHSSSAISTKTSHLLNEADMDDQLPEHRNPQTIVGAYATPASDISTPCMDDASSLNPIKKRTASSLTGRTKRRKCPQLREGNTNEVVLELIKNCRCEKGSLDDRHAREVQIVADFLFANNCRQLLQSQIKKWKQLPPLNFSAEGAARYIELFQRGDLSTQSLELRIAQVSFYVIYLKLCERLKRNQYDDTILRKKGDKVTTIVRNLVLEVTGGPVKDLGSEHIDLSGSLFDECLRWGKRWWELASGLGLGVLIASSEELAVRIRDEKFTNAQINALITYIRSARPGCLEFFQSLDSVTKNLMCGDLSFLITALEDAQNGEFGSLTLEAAKNKDETSLFLQNSSSEWPDTKTKVLSEKASLYF